ncbi:MAG: anti-sigma factor [Saprospiraceae bacterium]
MKIQEYIDSGLLEMYVAGALTEQEMVKVTTDINESLELKQEVEKLENAFMAYAKLHAPPISAALKASILQSGRNIATTPTDVTTPPTGLNKWICGLGLLFLVASIGYNIYQYQTKQSLEQNIETVESENKTFANDLEALQEKYNSNQALFAEIRQLSTKRVVLASVGKVAGAEAIVFWNTDTKNIFVDASSLPEPPEGKVYQLWWMISLDPLLPNNAGTLDGFAADDDKVFAALSTDRAVAFAITLEPEGGSESPTLEELYVLGQVS